MFEITILLIWRRMSLQMFVVLFFWMHKIFVCVYCVYFILNLRELMFVITIWIQFSSGC